MSWWWNFLFKNIKTSKISNIIFIIYFNYFWKIKKTNRRSNVKKTEKKENITLREVKSKMQYIKNGKPNVKEKEGVQNKLKRDMTWRKK